jgi:hypothetical protein
LLALCTKTRPAVECKYELDLVIEDVDPEISFMLVEMDLRPWKKKSQSVKALLYKGE